MGPRAGAVPVRRGAVLPLGGGRGCGVEHRRPVAHLRGPPEPAGAARRPVRGNHLLRVRPPLHRLAEVPLRQHLQQVLVYY